MLFLIILFIPWIIFLVYFIIYIKENEYIVINFGRNSNNKKLPVKYSNGFKIDSGVFESISNVINSIYSNTKHTNIVCGSASKCENCIDLRKQLIMNIKSDERKSYILHGLMKRKNIKYDIFYQLFFEFEDTYDKKDTLQKKADNVKSEDTVNPEALDKVFTIIDDNINDIINPDNLMGVVTSIMNAGTETDVTNALSNFVENTFDARNVFNGLFAKDSTDVENNKDNNAKETKRRKQAKRKNIQDEDLDEMINNSKVSEEGGK